MPDVIYVEQGTPEWFEARLGRATASKFGDIMSRIKTGESAQRKNYRAQLVAERLTGTKEDGFTSSAMAWGTETEPLARLRYSLKTGNEVEECGFFAHDDLLAGASPDGLIGTDGTLEIKCPNSVTHIETLRKQDVPYQYYWQVMGQLWMTNRSWCDFVSFDPRMPENAQFFTVRVHRDENKIRELELEVSSFLESVDLDVAFIKNYKG
jgi:putative phage-type endonuclease